MWAQRALTRIQSVILVAMVVLAGVSGSIAFVLWNKTETTAEPIKIGICADLDNVAGEDVWKAALLAAEQVNTEGGVLGRNLTIVGEDDDNGVNIETANNALTRLITADKADFILTPQSLTIINYQDISAQQKKILFSLKSALVELTQRVANNYDKYKYFFRVMNPNVTSTVDAYVDSLVTLRNYTGFNKVAFLTHDVKSLKDMASGMKESLRAKGFEIVYDNVFPLTGAASTDFSSHLAGVEASGAEILYPLLSGQAGNPLVKEWSERQSPFVIWGNVGYAGDSNFWNLTEGKCESVSFNGWPVIAGYPLTSKTVPAREAYIARWGKTIPNSDAAAAYDIVRFILPDAIKRARTTDSDAVIRALESTRIETSLARNFAFTSSHDVMMGAVGPHMIEEGYILPCLFQWQNGIQLPVYPKEMMKETGSTFELPPWDGPWSK